MKSLYYCCNSLFLCLVCVCYLSLQSHYLCICVSASTVCAANHAWWCTCELVYECVSACGVYTKQFILSALHIFSFPSASRWARFTHTYPGAWAQVCSNDKTLVSPGATILCAPPHPPYYETPRNSHLLTLFHLHQIHPLLLIPSCPVWHTLRACQESALFWCFN